MLIALIIDPQVINGAAETDALLHVRLLLRGILQNGVLLDTPLKRIANEIDKVVQDLPPKHGQAIAIMWEELKKSGARRLVSVPNSQSYSSATDSSDLAAMLKLKGLFDGYVTDKPNQPNSIALGKYCDSDCEQRRQTYLSALAALDLSAANARDFILRAIRFSKWLRMYDKQIGVGRDVNNFLIGIRYILDLYRSERVFRADRNDIQIYTTGDPTCRERIVNPLKKEYAEFNISVYVKKSEPLTHDRFLETQQGELFIGKGFDFIDKNGKFRPTSMGYLMDASDHLARYRKLPDMN